MEGRYISDLPAVELCGRMQLRGEQVYFWLINPSRAPAHRGGKGMVAAVCSWKTTFLPRAGGRERERDIRPSYRTWKPPRRDIRTSPERPHLLRVTLTFPNNGTDWDNILKGRSLCVTLYIQATTADTQQTSPFMDNAHIVIRCALFWGLCT